MKPIAVFTKPSPDLVLNIFQDGSFQVEKGQVKIRETMPPDWIEKEKMDLKESLDTWESLYKKHDKWWFNDTPFDANMRVKAQINIRRITNLLAIL